MFISRSFQYQIDKLILALRQRIYEYCTTQWYFCTFWRLSDLNALCNNRLVERKQFAKKNNLRWAAKKSKIHMSDQVSRCQCTTKWKWNILFEVYIFNGRSVSLVCAFEASLQCFFFLLFFSLCSLIKKRELPFHCPWIFVVARSLCLLFGSGHRSHDWTMFLSPTVVSREWITYNNSANELHCEQGEPKPLYNQKENSYDPAHTAKWSTIFCETHCVWWTKSKPLEIRFIHSFLFLYILLCFALLCLSFFSYFYSFNHFCCCCSIR